MKKSIVLSLCTAVIALSSCGPAYYDTEQFVDYIKTADGEMTERVPGEYYLAEWEYANVASTIVYLNGEYFISLNSDTFSPVLVSFENAENAIDWLDKTYARLTEVRQKMKDAGVEKIEEKITLDETKIFYVAGRSYKSRGPEYAVDRVTWINFPWIKVDLNDSDEDEIELKVLSNRLTITDKSYHAMIAALKSRDVMKKKLQGFVENGIDKHRSQKELEDSIY